MDERIFCKPKRMTNYSIYCIYFVALDYLLLGKNEIRKQRLDTNEDNSNL